MDTEKMGKKYKAWFTDPVRLMEIRACNFRPHPFCIGPQHFPKDGSIYIKPEQAPCAVKGCGLSYHEHTCDHAAFLQLTRNCTKDELEQVLTPALMQEFKLDGIDGFVFVETKEKYRHK